MTVLGSHSGILVWLNCANQSSGHEWWVMTGIPEVETGCEPTTQCSAVQCLTPKTTEHW